VNYIIISIHRSNSNEKQINPCPEVSRTYMTFGCRISMDFGKIDDEICSYTKHILPLTRSLLMMLMIGVAFEIAKIVFT
jgi:hypothetical protein